MPRLALRLPLLPLPPFFSPTRPSSYRTFASTSAIMAPTIERITLFKIPNEADQDRLLEQYKILAKTATKVCVLLLYRVVFLGTPNCAAEPLRFN